MPSQIKTGFPGFEHRIKSLLWRRTRGPNKSRPDYDKWNQLIEEWQTKRGASRRQAIVNASLAFNCLADIIADYDLTQYGIKKANESAEVSVPSKGIKQSYRENLRWAVDAAGREMRTGESPATCPNDAAFYLYRQAKEDPKDFLAKVGQVEIKASSKEELEEDDRKQATKSIKEIDEMLAALEEEEEKE